MEKSCDVDSIYRSLLQRAQEEHARARKQSRRIAWIRLLDVLGIATLLYFYFFSFSAVYLFFIFGLLVLYILLLNQHQKIKEKVAYHEREAEINEIELQFLQQNYYPFPDGLQFMDKDSLIQNDLDLLGDHSLYQYLNRCHSHLAQKKLAQWLLQEPSMHEVLSRQQAIQELSPETEFRNRLLVSTSLSDINEQKNRRLEKWTSTPLAGMAAWVKPTALAVSAIMLVLILLSGLHVLDISITKIIQYAAPIMLLLLISISRNLRQELDRGDRLSESILRLAQIQQMVEEKDFSSPALRQVTQDQSGEKYSQYWLKLARIMRNLETINNPLGALLLNAFFPFHILYYDRLVKWHAKYAQSMMEQVHRLSELELYIALSQYNYNHPENSAFSLSEDKAIQLHQARHPLMRPEESVPNSIDFGESPLYILTGSNMSGKSTFLRTIGSLLVMARLGLSLPCSAAQVRLQTLAPSMRISDSLSDSSSFFHAELTKLEQILNDTASQTLVLLDEILRGTNSDDKRTGTMEVIKKLIAKGDQGIVATHDLEVCSLEDEFPSAIRNICFESEIDGDDLHFDYTLRRGVCKNKNATFLMRKMNII